MAKTSKPNPIFTGEFRHALDDKKRVTVPSRWRAEDSEEVFVFKNPKRPCLTVMSAAAFEAIGQNAKTNVAPAKLQDFIRQLYSQAQRGATDRQGRLLLAEDHCKQAGLINDAVLVGAFDRFEIWSPVNWQTFKESSQVDYEQTAELVGI